MLSNTLVCISLCFDAFNDNFERLSFNIICDVLVSFIFSLSLCIFISRSSISRISVDSFILSFLYFSSVSLI